MNINEENKRTCFSKIFFAFRIAIASELFNQDNTSLIKRKTSGLLDS